MSRGGWLVPWLLVSSRGPSTRDDGAEDEKQPAKGVDVRAALLWQRPLRPRLLREAVRAAPSKGAQRHNVRPQRTFSWFTWL